MTAWKELKQLDYPSGRRGTHNERITRLFRNAGISVGHRPEHREELDAPYQLEHNEPLHQNGDGAHERGRSKFGQTLGGTSGGISLRKITQTDIMRELLVRLARAPTVRERLVAVVGVEPTTPRI